MHNSSQYAVNSRCMEKVRSASAILVQIHRLALKRSVQQIDQVRDYIPVNVPVEFAYFTWSETFDAAVEIRGHSCGQVVGFLVGATGVRRKTSAPAQKTLLVLSTMDGLAVTRTDPSFVRFRPEKRFFLLFTILLHLSYSLVSPLNLESWSINSVGGIREASFDAPPEEKKIAAFLYTPKSNGAD